MNRLATAANQFRMFDYMSGKQMHCFNCTDYDDAENNAWYFNNSASTYTQPFGVDRDDFTVYSNITQQFLSFQLGKNPN